MLSRRVLNIYFDVLFQFPFRNIFAIIANRVTPIYSKCMRNFNIIRGRKNFFFEND